MAKAVLFDMDGVLAFTEQFYNRRRMDYLAEHGLCFDEVPDFSGSDDAAMWEALIPDDAGRRRRLHAGYEEYSSAHPTPWATVANPQAATTFGLLRRRGISVAICSSSPRALVDELVVALDVEGLVDCTMSGYDCSEFKPSPEIYLRTMGGLGVSADQSIVVEDSPIGIAAGKRSGALVCALRPPAGVRLDQSGADVIIDHLMDVVPLAMSGRVPRQ